MVGAYYLCARQIFCERLVVFQRVHPKGIVRKIIIVTNVRTNTFSEPDPRDELDLRSDDIKNNLVLIILRIIKNRLSDFGRWQKTKRVLHGDKLYNAHNLVNEFKNTTEWPLISSEIWIKRKTCFFGNISSWTRNNRTKCSFDYWETKVSKHSTNLARIKICNSVCEIRSRKLKVQFIDILSTLV